MEILEITDAGTVLAFSEEVSVASDRDGKEVQF
jgi:hypothetical protein